MMLSPNATNASTPSAVGGLMAIRGGTGDVPAVSGDVFMTQGARRMRRPTSRPGTAAKDLWVWSNTPRR